MNISNRMFLIINYELVPVSIFYSNFIKVIQILSHMILLFLATLISLSIQHIPLTFRKPIEVTINPSSSQIYELSLPPSIQTNQDLFITAIPTLDVPSQIPTISVQSNNITYKCLQANNQLQGLCIISRQDLILQLNQTLLININCIETCSFVLEAYLNDLIKLDFAQKYTLLPKSDSMAIYQFEIDISDQNWDEINLEAEFQLEKIAIDKGVQMYANVGDAGEPMPTQLYHRYKAVQIHRGIGISIVKADVASGNRIKIAIFSNKNIEISLSAHKVLNSIFQLALHKRTYAFLSNGNQKKYVLDLAQSISSLKDKDVYVTVLIYSGYPQIILSFDASLKNKVENYGIAGSLSYLLTPSLRDSLNFRGMIYIKVVSQTEAYIQISSAINPQDFIYMEESVTYLSFIPPYNIQNYVYDFNYQLYSNESSEKIVHFTAKIKVTQGMGYFSSRICNSKSVSQCILANYSQMEDKQFRKQVDDLPANILMYGSLYEVYMYTPVNKCRMTKQTSTSTIYFCRIHMVGFNVNSRGQLQWGITAYSRLKSIELSQGKPFKDMVYQDSYNYYVFKVPPNITELTIFVSTLSGECALVTSQIFTNPQLIFSFLTNNDIRIGANNVVKYSQGQLKEKVFIGIYGKSMAEYVINVAVKRSSYKNTVISLIPKIQQFFHVQAETSTFGLIFNCEGEWVAEIVQFIGSVFTSLQDDKLNIICKSFSRCLFNATRKDQMTLSVRSEKYAKFAINYYPKQQCRVFSVGVVNFIEIQPNSTECVQYFINIQNLQISYSQNLVDSFSAKAYLNLSINNHQLGLMDSHYLTITKQELNILCKNSNQSSITKNCLLSMKISGDSHSKVELQISVVDLSTPIPLLDGITLPFSHKNFKKQSRLYFYYFSLSANTPTLFIRSLTYQSFFVAFKWIDYTSYANSTSYSSLFPPLLAKADFKSSFEIDEFHRSIQLKTPILPGSPCEECLLLVSIYAREDYRESVFQLEISSQQGSVQLGETVSIELNKDQFYSYQLQRSDSKEKVVVSLQNYKKGTDCYEAILTSDQSLEPIPFSSNEMLLSNNKMQHKVTVRSFQDNCRIQFFYWMPDFPMRIIYSGSRYSVSLENQQSTYFLYYHSANTSFHLSMAAKSGYIKCKATPIQQNQTLQSVMQKQDYLFGTDSIYEDIQISATDINFCMNCYYLIKVTAVPSAKGVIGVIDQFSPAEIAADEVLREKVKKGVRYYQYYSHSQFRLKIGIVYGEVNLQVTDEWKDEIVSQVLKSDRELTIKANNSKGDSLGRFLIKVSINNSATYSLQIVDDRSIRLVQGFPISHTFKDSNDVAIFVYSHTLKTQFNLLVIIDEEEVTTNPTISLGITAGQRNQSAVSSGKLGNIYYYDISGQKIDYHFTLKAEDRIKIKLLVTRNNLTFLQPSTTSLAKNSTIYELYTNGSPIMLEIFSCKGNIQVSASSKYSQINDSLSSSVIALQHSNIGGHYVIESRSNQLEYFAWVRSINSEPPQFLISYNKIKNLAYGYFSTIERSITYQVNGNDLEMVFQVPALINKQLKDISANFSFIAADNNADFNSLIQCGIGNSFLNIKRDLPPINEQAQIFKFNISKEDFKGLLSKGVHTCFMGIVVQIRFKEDGQSRLIKYIYQTLQLALVFPQNQYANSSNTVTNIFQWLVLPIILGIAISGAAFYFCFKKYRMMVQIDTALVEESESGLPALNMKSQQMDVPKEGSVQ